MQMLNIICNNFFYGGTDPQRHKCLGPPQKYNAVLSEHAINDYG